MQFNNNFDIDKEFFIIDSSNLNNIQDKLYGFCLNNGNIVLDADKIEEQSFEGAYVHLKNQDDKLIIKQDFTGCYGLYLFKKDNYFALSNSFLYLADYLKNSGYILTFNKQYADAFLNRNIETFAYKETIINEINVLDRNAIITIDKNKKNMDVSLINFNENTIEPDTEEFFEILDKWYEKWVKIIRNLKQKTNNISVDLTGGFDSRVTFLLFLGANINLDEICINSINDELYTHKEDYEIAQEMANHYGFVLNNKDILSKNYVPVSIEDNINIFSYLKLAFHKEIYADNIKFINPKYCFGGMGGECIRKYWDYGIEGLIKKESCMGTNIKINKQIKNSIKDIIYRASEEIKKIYQSFNNDYFDICYYRETSNRTHFGKATLEHFYLNKFCLSPIFDSDLHKLKLCNKTCNDKDLLIAIIYTRYIKDIIDFKFNGNRFIKPETIEYAKKLNKKYNYNLNLASNKVSKVNNNDCDEKIYNDKLIGNPNSTIEFLKEIFLSQKTKKNFTSIYNNELYNSIVYDVINREFHPLTHVLPVLAITKFKDVCKNVSCSSYYRYLLRQKGELINIHKIIKKHNNVKNSILENIFSIKNTTDKKFKSITILGINLKIRRPPKFSTKKINKRIKKAKFVHIMFNDKFNKPYVDFLNSNFNQNHHLILCKRTMEHSFPEGENVIEITSLKDLIFDDVEKIICHSLFDGELVNYLYEHKNILKEKAYWVIWGGDLYEAPRDEKNDFIRSNFKGYINKIDEQVCRKKYKNIPSNVTFVEGSYIFPINKKILDSTTKIEKDYIQVQINNSCDESTLEMLNVLSKFKNENIKIITILSYGQLEFKEQIIKKGKEIFEDKFTYIENYLSSQDYAQHLAQNDILILNQNRQQGVGNTRASLYLGSKVFIRSDISTYKFLNESGCKIFDTKTIAKLTFEEFSNYYFTQDNKQNIAIYFDENYLAKVWEKIFIGDMRSDK